jgi:hypothetical protein
VARPLEVSVVAALVVAMLMALLAVYFGGRR